MEERKSIFEEIFNGICTILKPSLIINKFFSPLKYFFCFFYDPIEEVLYWKGKDKEFEIDISGNEVKYGDLDIKNIEKCGTVGNIFIECGNEIRDNRYNYKAYYYPYVSKDPKKQNTEADNAIIEKINKTRKQEDKIGDYAAIFFPLILFDEKIKKFTEVIGIGCFIGNGPDAFSSESKKWDLIECELKADTTSVVYNEIPLRYFVRPKEKNFLSSISCRLAEAYSLINTNLLELSKYITKDFFRIVQSLNDADVKEAIYKVTREGITLRKAIEGFIGI